MGKLDQMETRKSVEQKSISSDHKTEQIQKEITDLKQLILDLHAKEQKVKSTQKPTPRPQQQTYSHQKRSVAARHSMIYDRNNPLIDDDDDEDIQLDDLRDLSPIPMPKSYQKAPAPHPYPVKTNPKMTLAQLRKYSLPSTESTSSSCTLPTSQSESSSP